MRRGIVARSELLDRLVAAPSPAVISVVAPAGYGKTTLLAQWAERSNRGWDGSASTTVTTTPSSCSPTIAGVVGSAKVSSAAVDLATAIGCDDLLDRD